MLAWNKKDLGDEVAETLKAHNNLAFTQLEVATMVSRRYQDDGEWRRGHGPGGAPTGHEIDGFKYLLVIDRKGSTGRFFDDVYYALSALVQLGQVDHAEIQGAEHYAWRS